MARVANPLIGKTSGSIGGVTFSSWKGVNIAKSKPTTVANPNSDPQKAQRSAFSAIVAIYRAMTAILTLGFKELALKKSAFNAFVSQNLKNAFDFSSPPAATFLPENFKISKGTISSTPITEIVASLASLYVSVTYPTTTSDPGQSATDKPLMAVFNETKDEWAYNVGDATRADGSDSVAIIGNWEVGDSIHVFLGFVNAAGEKASDSVYAEGNIES